MKIKLEDVTVIQNNGGFGTDIDLEVTEDGRWAMTVKTDSVTTVTLSLFDVQEMIDALELLQKFASKDEF